MNSRWTILTMAPAIALGFTLSGAAFAAEETTTTSEEGDVLIVEEVEGTESEARRVREADFPTPTRGMDMDKVRAEFGEPAREHPAVGDPPITRWDYDRYSVFFEYDKVLHSVVTEDE